MCSWLFEVGAAADINKASMKEWGGELVEASTPLRSVEGRSDPSMHHWLILKGALLSTPDGHPDPCIFCHDISSEPKRMALGEWASEQVAANAEFRCTVLPGTFSRHKSAHLWKLGSLDAATNTHLKALVADFVGVPHGRALRNAREAAEALCKRYKAYVRRDMSLSYRILGTDEEEQAWARFNHFRRYGFYSEETWPQHWDIHEDPGFGQNST